MAQRTLPASLLAGRRLGTNQAPAEGAAEVTVADASDRADSGAALDRQLTSDEVKRVWLPLLRLRQACCHPQVQAEQLQGYGRYTDGTRHC